MTAFLRAFLFCSECGGQFDDSSVPAARTVSEARRDAKKCGWAHKRDGRDMCPDCQPSTAP